MEKAYKGWSMVYGDRPRTGGAIWIGNFMGWIGESAREGERQREGRAG